jgi:hypothetical protein
MDAKYYVAVRPQTNDFHSVHKEGCPFLPDDSKRIDLGVSKSDLDALNKGLKYFTKACSCLFCSKEEQEHEGNMSLFNKKSKAEEIPAKLQIPIAFHQGLMCCLN